MSNSTSNNENTSRWWEFYVVRYGMGTVVGAVIVFLLFKTSPTLVPMLFQAGKKEDASIDGPTLALLAGYGLAYCYLASAPILVFHVMRYAFFNRCTPLTWGAPFTWRTPFTFPWRTPFILLIATICSWWLFSFNPFTLAAQHVLGFATFAGFTLFFVQIYGLGEALLCTRTSDLFHFYRTLTDARARETTSIVESYRHLREHGNSFLIIVFEMVLGFILFGVSNAPSTNAAPFLFATIFFWALPAALVWFVGTYLEHLFVKSHQDTPPQATDPKNKPTSIAP